MKTQVVTSEQVLEDLRKIGYVLPQRIARFELVAGDLLPQLTVYAEKASEWAAAMGAPGVTQTVTEAHQLHKRVVDAIALPPLDQELAREFLAAKLAWAESHRRERPTLDAAPIAGVLDYAAAAQAITHGLHHLDEALPNGQKERAEAGLMLALAGVIELAKWMRAKGYTVDGGEL